MKTRLALAAAIVPCLAALADGSTWYLIKTETSFTNMCHNAVWWSSDGTADGELSGEDGDPLNAGDRYVINAGKAIRLAADQGQYGGPSVFTCKRITFGEEGNNNYGCARCYSRNANNHVDFGSGADQEGVYLHNGYITGYRSYKKAYTGSLTGKMTVTAPESVPFRITTGPNDYTMQITGTVFRAASGTGLCIGGLVSAAAATGSATNFKFCAYCDMSEFFGRMTVEPCCTSVEDFPDFVTTLYVGSMSMPGTLELRAGSVFAPTGAACVVTLGNANFVGGSRIALPVENVEGPDGVIRPRCPLIVVSDAVSAFGIVTFEFSGDAEIPADGLTNRLALVVAKKGGLDKTNFAITLSEALDPYGWYGKYGVLLEVAEDETTGEQTLVAVFQPLVKMIYSDAGTKGPSGATRLAVTNASAWSDGKLPHSGSHYLIANGDEVTGKTSGKTYMFTAITNGTYFFPGESLTIASNANMYVFSAGFSVPVLRLLDGAALRGGQTHSVAFSNMVLIAESGVVELSAFGSGGQFHVYGDLQGSAEVRLGTQTSTSVPQGQSWFYGDNSEFVGTLVVSQYVGGAYSQFAGGKVQLLHLMKDTDLGGALETFNPAALLVSQFDKITLDNDVSISTNLNRGMTVVGNAVVDTAAYSFGLGMPLTIDGTLYKTGVGTLRLDADRVGVGEGGGTIIVTNGTLAVASAEALDGFTVALAPSTELVLKANLSDEKLTRYGIKHIGLETPFALGEGVASLPLSIDVSDIGKLPQSGGVIGVLTVSDAATNALERVFSVPKFLRGVNSTPVKIHDDENGWTTYAARYEHVGIRILFR